MTETKRTFSFFLQDGEKGWERVLTSVRGVCWDWGERHCSKSPGGGLGIAGISQHSDHITPTRAAMGGRGEEQLTGGEAGGQRRLRVQKPMGRKDKRRVVFAVRLLPQRAQGKFRIRNILEIFRNAMNKNELLQTLSGLHYICF